MCDEEKKENRWAPQEEILIAPTRISGADVSARSRL